MKMFSLALIIIIIIIVAGYLLWPPPTAPTTDLSSTTSGSVAAINNQSNQTITPAMSSSHLVTITTDLGEIKFQTYNQDAPNTVANFVKLARQGFYNNLMFHRVINGFMIQTGDPTGTGRGGPGYTFADELNPAAESYQRGYVKGTVAMANAGPNTNGSQFFIMVADVPLPKNYTIFGHVVSGQEVADQISHVATDPEDDRPLKPVMMKSVMVTDIQ